MEEQTETEEGETTMMPTKRYNYYKNMPRSEYIRRTFTLLTIQLVMVSVIMCPLSLIEPLRLVVTSDIRISFSALIIFIVANLVIIFCSHLMQIHPFSYVLLFIITLITGFWCGVICAKFKTIWVIVSIFFVIFLCLTLTVVAIKGPYDVTKLMGPLLGLTLIAVIGCIIFFFWSDPIFKWIILIGSSLLTSVYFVVDWQMIMGGHHHVLHVEDFVLSSSLIFIDIVFLLVYSVMIIGEWHH